MDNLICFCGSGKLRNECHPDIHEKSRAARVLKLYNNIDSKIESHYRINPEKYPCEKGCNECCYTDFPFSDIEMDLISYELSKWNVDKISMLMKKAIANFKTIVKKYPEYVKTLSTYEGGEEDVVKSLGYDVNSKDFPCSFMDAKSKECMIYKVRPITCRTHGTAFYNYGVPGEEETRHYNICSNIGIRGNAYKFQADLNEFNNEIKGLYFISMIPYSVSLTLRLRPMFFYIYVGLLKYKKLMVPKDYDLKLHEPEEKYIQYVYNKASKNGLLK